MNAVKNLIFDLDGTLIDSSEGVVAAVNHSLRKVGAAEQPPEVIKSFIGYPLSRMYPHFTDAPVKVLYEHFRTVANESVVDATVALPGAEAALEDLYGRGYRLAVATTKVRVNVDGIIRKLGWAKLFDATVAGDEVSRVKPDPAALHLALDRMEANADQTAVVGDTENDVLAARAVPLPVIAVVSPYGGHDRLLAARPDFLIESVSDLPALLEQHNRVLS